MARIIPPALPESISSRKTYRVVTVPRGSWRWQDAFRVVRYRVRQARDGRALWYAAENVTGKMSMPQLRGLGWGDTPRGTLHHRPVEV
jgi:hypothetical protein